MPDLVVLQHVTEAIHLREVRSMLVRAPHVALLQLERHDERLIAYLDGIAIALEDAPPHPALFDEPAECGALFTLTIRALESTDPAALAPVFALAGSRPEAIRGLLSALGWVEPARLRGHVAALLASDNPIARLAGLAASSMHRVDPGVGTRFLDDASPLVRARAMRAAGELGKREFVSKLAQQSEAGEPECKFWAAWAAVLLGDRSRALMRLAAAADEPGALQAMAFEVSLLASTVEEAHRAVQALSQDAARTREVIRGAGFIGDAKYVPWLIGQMGDEKLARLAGESFSMISGLDLAWLDLERKPPENFQSGPTDEPEDENVEMDEDDGLAWPDQSKVQAWWNLNGARFTTGVRHFMGQPPNRAHCIEVLKNGYQRQRIAAAYHLCLLNPGTPLFEWRAPAWRQQRELAQMT